MRRLIWKGDNSFELVKDAPLPLVGSGQVLVRTTAVGICGTDVHILEGRLSMARPPLVLGHEIAGVVAALGSGVEGLHLGDRVTIDQVVGCGNCFFCRRASRQFCERGFELGITADGGCQEFIVLPQENVFPVPANISDEAAAILDMEIWGALSKCGIAHGETVVILGDGPAGMIACQVAHIKGAGKIILGGLSRERMSKARNLNLAHLYVMADREDVSERVLSETAGRGADVAVDCTGEIAATLNTFKTVRCGGRVVLYGVHMAPVQSFDFNSIVLRDLVVYGALSDRSGWQEVLRLAEIGKLRFEPLITHRFPLEDAPGAYEVVRRHRNGVVKAVIVL